MIKLIALDLDGTLLDSSGVISDDNRSAIRAAEELGVLVTVATGRRFRDARPVALEIGFNAPIVTHNGALLKNAETLETVHASLLETATTVEVIRVGAEFGGDALLSSDPRGSGSLLYGRISEDNFPLQKYIAWAARVHKGSDEGSAVVQVTDLAEAAAATEIVHVSFSGHCAPMSELKHVLGEALGDKVNILSTIYPEKDFTLLDVLPAEASKASGIAHLAAVHGISREEIMAIGDNHNDLEMLEYAAVPVVMANAQHGLLERTDFHQTLSQNESGVARAIERFVLGR